MSSNEPATQSVAAGDSVATDSPRPPIEEIVEQQPINVVERDGVQFTLLGTAHVSRTSAEVVEHMVLTGDFDCVAVELCDSRLQALADPDGWKQMDLFQIIRQGKVGLVAANLALGSYQRRLAEQFGIEPGAEMKAALEAADNRELPHAPIDRDIGVTLRRVISSVRWWEKLSMFGGIVFSLFSREQITEEEIEQLKEGDMLENTFGEFAEKSEGLYGALIDERDHFMAAKLRSTAEQGEYQNVLAVVGAGHLKGLTQQMSDQQEPPESVTERLSEVPPRSKFLRTLPWLITAIIVTGFAIGFSRSPQLGWSLLGAWVLINGTLSAIGAAIAGGHPLTIISGFVAAPITSLNPTVGAGMVTASVEAFLRKPVVDDFERLRDDVMAISGWWKNRVSKVFLVFILTNFGSALGTWIGGFKIFAALT